MGFFDFINNGKKIQELEAKLETQQAEIQSYGGVYKPIYYLSYDGEKNMGELGELTKYRLDYTGLRTRSWKSYLDDEVTQTIIKRFTTWIIGGGLKLQSEPMMSILEHEGISFDSNKFTRNIEDHFKLYASTKMADYCGKDTLDKIARTAYNAAIVGGDVLVVLRLEKGIVKVQLIDGAHVMTPLFNTDIIAATKLGHDVRNGIEMNKRGEHVAYWIRTLDGKYERIPVKGQKSNKEMAFMIYGLRYRIDDNRGIPVISTVLETLAKLNRYKEAAVGSAEERAKIVYQIIHQAFSTGESPLSKNLAKAFNVDAQQEVPTDINGKQLADTIAVSTNKQTFNMPVGSEMKSLDSKNEMYFKDFYSVLVNVICSSVGIPPEVALSKYDSNFSASRAALKDWEHTIQVERKEFYSQFYKKIYDLWFDVQVLSNRVNAPGYLSAIAKDDQLIIEAYKFCRFVGASVPHIDPVKEVTAERLKLGDAGKSIPLTTAEAASEHLNSGEYMTNAVQFADELKKSKELDIVAPLAPVSKPFNNNNAKEEDE
jgi:capsid protein